MFFSFQLFKQKKYFTCLDELKKVIIDKVLN